MQCWNCHCEQAATEQYILDEQKELVELLKCECRHPKKTWTLNTGKEELRNVAAAAWIALKKLKPYEKFPQPKCTRCHQSYGKWYMKGQARYCQYCDRLIEILKQA